MPLDLGHITETLGRSATAAEERLTAAMQDLQGKDLSATDMLQLQYKMNKWQLANELQTNVMKTMSDTVKGTIQNIR